MPENAPNQPEREELKDLQLPQQASIRNFLRIAGPVALGLGVICCVTAFISLISSSNSFEPPRFFWLGFVGLPLLFAGFVMSGMGYMGAIARYQAAELAPVGTDAAKYVAEETQGAVETVAKAAAKGIVEGIEAGRAKPGEGKD